jgi:virginiamycin B lyase
MRGRNRVGCVLALAIVGVVGVVVPVGAADKKGHVTEFSAGITGIVLDGEQYGASLEGITAGPDGNLWFTEILASRVGRITPAGVVTEFSAGITGSPEEITAGPDSNLWFTEPSKQNEPDQIGRITPAGVVTEFSAGLTSKVLDGTNIDGSPLVNGAAPQGIAAGRDGNLWFTEPGTDRIGRITPAGVITEFSTGITPESDPTAITAGSDGNIWFTENSAGQIGRITPQGKVTEFPVDDLSGITAGTDGNIWFTEPNANAIGRITSKGKVTEFSRGIASAAGPYGITTGCDGNLWFTEALGNRIGRITTTGKVTEFSNGVTPGANLGEITAGPDGNIWFIEFELTRIGRIGTGPSAKGGARHGPALPAACRRS